MRRLDALLLAGIGVLILHQVAYTSSAMLGYENSVTHGHLALAWFGGSLAVLGILARAITRSLKRRDHESGPANVLCGQIVVGYLLMEQFERALDGYGTFSLFAEPVFWLGLGLAPLVAIALHWSVKSVVAAIEAFVDALPTIKWDVAAAPRTPQLAFVRPTSSHLSSVVSRRGPPTHLSA